MAGIQDFITNAASKLGIDKGAAGSATGALASLIQKAAGSADFGKIASAIPGLSDLAAKAGVAGGDAGGGGGLGGLLGGLAQKAGGMLGGAGGGAAAGAVAAVTSAGVAPDKVSGFISMFVDFLKSKVSPDLLKSVLSKVPALAGLVG